MPRLQINGARFAFGARFALETRAELVRAIVWARRGARLASELGVSNFFKSEKKKFQREKIFEDKKNSA